MLSISEEISRCILQESETNPRVLVTATTWWPLSARLADSLSKKQCKITGICPTGHPLRFASRVDQLWRYSPWQPLRTLAAAIAAARPDLIIPCDDRAVAHLHDLHAQRPDLRALIERSLGDPASYAVAGSRTTLLSLAAAEGIATPPNGNLGGPADIAAFAAENPFPWVVKRDRSWGGRGVRIVHDRRAAEAAFGSMSARPGLLAAAKNLLVNRDAFPLGEWRHATAPAVSLQGFVHGCPANALGFCRNGEVLAEICVEALATTDPTGAATVVRVIENAAMSRAMNVLVRRLRLSGFCGLDFMISQATGQAFLIEMNPRPTQLGHLPLGDGRDLTAALVETLTGRRPPPEPAIAEKTIALFPGALFQHPPSEHFSHAHHDMPTDDPALLRELHRTAWPNRSLFSRLHRRWQRRGRVAQSRPIYLDFFKALR